MGRITYSHRCIVENSFGITTADLAASGCLGRGSLSAATSGKLMERRPLCPDTLIAEFTALITIR